MNLFNIITEEHKMSAFKPYKKSAFLQLQISVCGGCSGIIVSFYVNGTIFPSAYGWGSDDNRRGTREELSSSCMS